MKKYSVTDFWGKSKQQLIFHKAFSHSAFIASRVELTHLSAPHCVQFANAIDVSEGLICLTKALRCPEICTLITGFPETTSLTQSCLLYSSQINVERNFISVRVLSNKAGKETISQHNIRYIWCTINYIYAFMWPRITVIIAK